MSSVSYTLRGSQPGSAEWGRLQAKNGSALDQAEALLGRYDKEDEKRGIAPRVYSVYSDPASRTLTINGKKVFDNGQRVSKEFLTQYSPRSFLNNTSDSANEPKSKNGLQNQSAGYSDENSRKELVKRGMLTVPAWATKVNIAYDPKKNSYSVRVGTQDNTVEYSEITQIHFNERSDGSDGMPAVVRGADRVKTRISFSGEPASDAPLLFLSGIYKEKNFELSGSANFGQTRNVFDNSNIDEWRAKVHTHPYEKTASVLDQMFAKKFAGVERMNNAQWAREDDRRAVSAQILGNQRLYRQARLDKGAEIAALAGANSMQDAYDNARARKARINEHNATRQKIAFQQSLQGPATFNPTAGFSTIGGGFNNGFGGAGLGFGGVGGVGGGFALPVQTGDYDFPGGFNPSKPNPGIPRAGFSAAPPDQPAFVAEVTPASGLSSPQFAATPPSNAASPATAPQDNSLFAMIGKFFNSIGTMLGLVSPELKFNEVYVNNSSQPRASDLSNTGNQTAAYAAASAVSSERYNVNDATSIPQVVNAPRVAVAAAPSQPVIR